MGEADRFYAALRPGSLPRALREYMAVVNFKAVGAGVSSFLIFYAMFTFSVGFEYQDGLGKIGFWLLPIFMAPGFVAGAIAKSHGVINGATVGLLIGLIALVTFLYPFQGEASGAIGAATVFGASVIFFSSLGGLLWHVYAALIRVLRGSP